ncbi:PsiF family protein [Bradyrhizobium sp. LHD-71]|uniref:PsiF family protein n=1 Tax=Bradyrhizobium sp. LHD-71 TaxID=3072141 RepID=UPI00280E4CAF|nr:PsiF family protein [Bradyrhizobium sp. LHD-71]MDQ8726682.1 PsiF family protein [Bradyrhizobium sp. LHD-71]
MQKLTIILASAVSLALVPNLAAAQAASPKPRSALSIECSKEADAKGLHGKDRKHFRAECKKAGKSGTSTTGKSS